MPTEIKTEKGELRIWAQRNTWSWATPNGSEGSGEDTFGAAAAAAMEAEGLKAERRPRATIESRVGEI